ncbi:hypothetical protein [Bacillus infantis]|uniref:hypothetical protein n=1 Tax=Bacillus infantis TaxID=324767 RepID=UPI003CFB21ED
MSNVRVKPVKIMLDKERTILFDLNALCELEETYESVFDALADIEKMKMKSIRSILHAALVHEDESLTLKQVGSFIGMHNILEISAKLTAAFTDSQPEVKETEGKAKNE